MVVALTTDLRSQLTKSIRAASCKLLIAMLWQYKFQGRRWFCYGESIGRCRGIATCINQNHLFYTGGSGWYHFFVSRCQYESSLLVQSLPFLSSSSVKKKIVKFLSFLLFSITDFISGENCKINLQKPCDNNINCKKGVTSIARTNFRIHVITLAAFDKRFICHKVSLLNQLWLSYFDELASYYSTALVCFAKKRDRMQRTQLSREHVYYMQLITGRIGEFTT